MSTVPGFGLREDLGDAFGVLYDVLSDSDPTVGDLEAFSTQDAYGAASSATRAAIADISDDLWITTAPLARAVDDGPAAIFGALTAINDALGRAGTTPPGNDDHVARRLRSRLRRTGGLHLTPGAGAVLVKRAHPTRPGLAPESLREAFNVLRVSASTWSSVRQVVVRASQDHPIAKLDQLAIVSIPMGAELADLSMTSTQTSSGRRVYKAAPTVNIRDRVPYAAEVLDSCGADLALLPEVTLDAASLAEWRNQSGDTLPTWILLGTGPVVGPAIPGALAHLGTTRTSTGPLPPNRAVLMHGPSGQLIAAQDKQFGFTIRTDYLEPYGLRAAPVETHDEGIEVTNQMTVIESNAGRFGVFVCEDLGRLPQLANRVQEIGLTHVLTPILATPIQLHRWQDSSANYLTTHVGTTVVVFNSLSLGRFHSGTPRGAYTMMTIRPDHELERADTKPVRNPQPESMSAVEDALTLRHGELPVG